MRKISRRIANFKLVFGPKELACFTFIFLAIVLWLRGLIFEGGLPLGADTLRYFRELEYYNIFGSWFSSWNWGSYLFTSQMSPLSWMLSFLGIPARIYPVLILLVGGLSAYYFLSEHTKNIYARTTGTLIYLLNGENLRVLLQGTYTSFLLGYALFPLLFLLFDRVAKRGKIRDVALFATVMSFYVVSVSPQITYILLASLLFYALWHVTFSHKWGEVIKFSRNVLILTFVVAGLLSYQLLPFSVGVRSWQAGATFPIQEAFHWSQPLIRVLGLIGGVLIPIVAFSSLFFRRDKYTLFFGILAIIGIFLSKELHPPLGEFFAWACTHVPFFSTFRVAQKFLVLAVLACSFLVSVTIEEVFKRLKSFQKIAVLKLITSKRTFSLQIKSLIPLLLILLVLFSLFCSIGTGPIPMTFNPDELEEFGESVSAYEQIRRGEGDELSYIISLEPGGREHLWIDKDSIRYPTIHPLIYNLPISGRPELNFDWDSFGKSFIYWFPRNALLEESSAQVMKFLGALNVEYIFSPLPNPYASSISSQKGSRVLFPDKETIAAWKNDCCVPHVYAGEPIAFLGGFETFTALPELPNFDFASSPLLSLAQNWDHQSSIFNLASSLVLYDSHFTDLLVLDLLNSENVIPIEWDVPYKMHHRIWSREPERKDWVASREWLERGEMVYNELTPTTSERATMSASFSINEPDEYELWVRVAHGPKRGELEIRVDGNSLLKIRPSAQFYGFEWHRIPLHLEKGEHNLELINDGTGFNSVDAVFLAKQDQVLLKQRNLAEALMNTSSRFVNLWEAEKLLGSPLPDGWNIRSLEVESSIQSQVLGSEDGTSGSAEIYLPKSSYYKIAVRTVRSTVHGRLNLNVDSTPISIFDCYVGAPARENSVLHLTFDENTGATARDGSIHRNDGTIYGATWTDGKLGSALEFDGLNNYVEIADDTSLNFTGDGTWEAWIKVPPTEEKMWILTKGTGWGQNQAQYEIMVWSDGKLKFRTWGDSEFRIASESRVDTNEWVHVAVVKEGTTYRLYVNGVKEAEATGPVELPVTNSVLSIGYLRYHSEKYYFKGVIDEVRIYDRALSENELFESSFQWFETEPFWLDLGVHSLSLRGDGKVDIDKVLIYSIENDECGHTLDHLFSSSGEISVSSERIAPYKWRVSVETDRRVLLVFSELYNPLWRAYLDDEEVKPLVVNNLFNGFLIDGPGKYDIVLEYMGQRYVRIGGAISIVTLLIAIFLIVKKWR